ncbi:hypothetical protein [Piscirickettsia salmonis]|uniref:hypothetical protein n=1 Tax=Piscirickettsia salmonis TaxID=1238 RepID=UPI001E45DBF4|nr:hypothetical protein [Piscirickettsia salmonis]QGP39374.1 hypothetical protein Psal182_01516 [Piscirickettsia salmonis]
MTNEQNKIYCITNLQGIVTFVSRSFLNFYNVEQHHVVGKRANQCVTFPLGCAQAIKDIIDIAREKVTKARREGITISKEGFFVGALHKYPQIRKRRYLGRYFAHPMMQNRRAKRDDYKPSAVRVTQRCVP